MRGAIFGLLGELASAMESSVASFCEMLIVTGSIFEYVRLEDAEHLQEFACAARANRFADEIEEKNLFKKTLISLSRTSSVLVSGPTRNRPHIEGSKLMQVRLSSRFVRRIDLYAKVTKASRSAVLTRFFEKGLLLYMRSQRDLMTAIVEAMKTKADDAQTKIDEPLRASHFD
jgi:predicted transcriptional regulator